MCLQIHAFRHFQWPERGGAYDPDFSVDLSRSRANFHGPEILYIFCRNCYTSQADANFSFPSGFQSPFMTEYSMGSLSQQYRRSLWPHRRFLRSYRRSLRSYRRTLRRCRDPWGDRQSPMPIVAQLTNHHKTYKTLWYIIKHREPLVKHHEPLVKYEESLKTLWNIMKYSNTSHSMRRHRRSRGVTCDIGAEFSAISANAVLV